MFGLAFSESLAMLLSTFCPETDNDSSIQGLNMVGRIRRKKNSVGI
jgi:hypothetical protein